MHSKAALLLMLLLSVAGPAAAQDELLTGRVVDAAGEPLAGARVEVISAETEITRSVLTDANGRYRGPGEHTAAGDRAAPGDWTGDTGDRRGGFPAADGLDLRGLLSGQVTSADSAATGVLANPVEQVLEMRDSLRLTPVQVAGLESAADRLASQLDDHRDVLVPLLYDLIGRGGADGADREVIVEAMRELQPVLQDVRRDRAAALVEVRRILTDEQWNQLPAAVRGDDRPTRRRRG